MAADVSCVLGFLFMAVTKPRRPVPALLSVRYQLQAATHRGIAELKGPYQWFYTIILHASNLHN